MIEILITGNPIAKARARHVRRGKHIATYNPQKADENRIKAEIKGQYFDEPISGPIKIEIAFFLNRPKKHYRTGFYAGLLKDSAPHEHTSKPDIDNLGKTALDCMNGIIYQDDKQIVSLSCHKFYIVDDEVPHTEITVLNENEF